MRVFSWVILFFFRALASGAEPLSGMNLLEEKLQILVEDEQIKREALTPLTIVRAETMDPAAQTRFLNGAITLLKRVFQSHQIRVCIPCVIPMAEKKGERLTYAIHASTLEEIRQYDDQERGESPRAKAALWLDETAEGLSFRIVSLQNGEILAASEALSTREEATRSTEHFQRLRNLEKQTRGEAITHMMIDVGVYPSSHIAFHFLEQWGKDNDHLVGLSLSILGPIAGIGPTYFRVLPKLNNLLLGGRILLSLPRAVQNAASQDGSQGIKDELFTPLFVARYPLPVLHGRLGIIFYASLTGMIGAGLSI